jgi:hypothetical protein
MAGLPKEIYVVVAEMGGGDKTPFTAPIAFESSNLDLESAKEFQKKIGARYGRTAIYKTVKVED